MTYWSFTMSASPHVSGEITDETLSTPFSQTVRTATAERHSKAENSSFMTRLMKGELDAAAYTRLLAQYEYIYEALEQIAATYRRTGERLTEPFNRPGLDRLASIRSDLHTLAGENSTPCLPATQRYVERIQRTAEQPERFLAHHYLRYLGDLSGGQAVAALMARHYDIPAEGLSMYRFTELPKPKVFKDEYRSLLDEAPLTDLQRQAFLDEAIVGFDLNAAVFAELDASVEPSPVSA